MKSFKIILASLLFLFLYLPPEVSIGQNAESELIQADNSTGTDEKITDKKKTKDVIRIDEMFFISLAIDLATVLLIILVIYYPNYRKRDYIFTFIIFNIVIFILTYVLNEVKISLGAAFGLFAVFTMLRYRTQGISTNEMTYLFIFIALGLISAIQLEYYELGILHGVILAGTFLLDGNYLFRREHFKTIRYENIELIKDEKHPELIEDLKKRTGLNIHRIEIGRIDFLRDTARIRVYYYG